MIYRIFTGLTPWLCWVILAMTHESSIHLSAIVCSSTRNVGSSENPADVASRSSYLNDLPKSWLNGPEFLRDYNFSCCSSPEKCFTLQPNDSEIKRVFSNKIHATTTDQEELLRHLNKFSSWKAITRVICYVLKFNKTYEDKIKKMLHLFIRSQWGF